MISCLTRLFDVFLALVLLTHLAYADIKEAPLPNNFRRYIRVALKLKVESCSLHSIGEALVRAKDERTGGLWKGSIKIGLKGGSLYAVNAWGNEIRSSHLLRIVPSSDFNFIEVGGYSYRGSFEVIKSNANHFMVVNEIPIDDYLKGVLPFEIGRHGREKLEALKAQAVAARTYTFKRLASAPPGRGFDVHCDINDQVYNGQSGEYLMADRAVRETRGMVAMHGNDLAECYYFSTCGGRTSTVNEVWTTKISHPYLQSIKDGDASGIFCTPSRLFNWRVEWTYGELNRIIKKSLPKEVAGASNAASLKGLKILERTTSGRIAKLQVKMGENKYVIAGDRIRWVLRRPEGDNPILYSAYFDLKKKPALGKMKKIVAVGKGWGHGVGMCQFGALTMARKGYSFEQIIGHYYTDIDIVQWKY